MAQDDRPTATAVRETKVAPAGVESESQAAKKAHLDSVRSTLNRRTNSAYLLLAASG